MSVKRKSYSADFKAKLVLEVLEGEKTVNEIASAYGVLPPHSTLKCNKTRQNYATIFLEISLKNISFGV